MPIISNQYSKSFLPATVDFDTANMNMDTIDEQLDAATAKVNELTAQLAEANAALETAQEEKTSMEAVNAELSDNLSACRDKLATMEASLREANAQIQQLKAEARTAEERAAEFYGTNAGQAVAVTAKGNDKTIPVAERFKAISTPEGQTQFIRSLSDAERAELFSNI